MRCGLRKPKAHKEHKEGEEKHKVASLVMPTVDDQKEKEQLEKFESMLEMENLPESLLFRDQSDLDFENFFGYSFL